MNEPLLRLVEATDDQHLEEMIGEAKLRMLAADARKDSDWTRRWSVVMALLLSQRSPDQVERMERRAGV